MLHFMCTLSVYNKYIVIDLLSSKKVEFILVTSF